MLTISLRTARLNQDHSGKTKEKDGEVTKLLRFGIDEVELDENELGAMTGEPHAARALVNNTKNGKRGFFQCFKPYQFTDEFDTETACVTVRLRGGEEFKFTGCKISKQRVAVIHDSGEVVYSCKVQAAPALDARYAQFIASFGELVDVEISGAQAQDQKQLPLSKHGEGEAPEQGGKRGRKGNGSQPAAH